MSSIILSDVDAFCIVKTPAGETGCLRGTSPIGLEHQLLAAPHALAIRSLLAFHDPPNASLGIETLTIIEGPDRQVIAATLAIPHSLGRSREGVVPR